MRKRLLADFLRIRIEKVCRKGGENPNNSEILNLKYEPLIRKKFSNMIKVLILGFSSATHITSWKPEHVVKNIIKVNRFHKTTLLQHSS